MGQKSIDFDELHEENLEAGADQWEEQIKDELGDGGESGAGEGDDSDGARDGEVQGEGDAGDGKADDFKQDDLDGIANEDPDQRSTSIPAGRVGEMAKERSLAIGIADGIVGGTVDPEAVKSLGGTVAVAKMLKSGDVSMTDLESLENVKPAEKVEPYDVAAGWKKYYDFMEDGDVDDANAIMKEISDAQDVATEERAQKIVNKTLEKRDADTVSRRRAKESKDADTTAAQVFTDHPELDKYADDFDAGELARFQANVGAFQEKGKTLKEAIELTENKLFPKVEKSDNKELSQREIAQRLKNADASNRQAPNLEKGNGLNASESTKKASDYTDDEWENLSDRKKSRMREDVPV